MPPLLAVSTLILIVLASPASSQSVNEQIQAMHWVRSGTIKFTASSSSVALPPGFIGVAGEDARKLAELGQGHAESDTEGVLIDDKSDDTVVFQFYPSGFITIDDWQELDPGNLIRQITDNTENGNEERRSKGIAELHVTGWLQEPSFDRNTKTVFWAIAAYSNEGKIVNSVALRLGRSGYEKVIWVTDPNSFKPAGGVLDTMLRSHSFDSGQRYEDHIEGDKLAGYGIAALVGAVAGAKLLKVGAFAALLILLKKFWFIAFALVAVFFRKIKALFTPRINPPGRVGPEDSA